MIRVYRKWRQSRGNCGVGPFKTSPLDPFNAACKNHDDNYVALKSIGGEKLRANIDTAFLEHMLSTRGGKVRAYIYYILARCFGWIPWYLNRK